MKISTIIPTFNRAQSLDLTIESYLNQTLSPHLHELIIVDNNSMDTTREIVEKWQRVSATKIKYLFEKRQGVHYARHSGYKSSSGDLLFFTDDDISFEQDLLTVYFEKFLKHQDLVAATGPSKPIWEEPPADWLLDFMGDWKAFPTFSIRHEFDDDRFSLDLYLYSCNLIIRREMFLERGGFNPEFTGDIWIGDGENGLNRAMKNAGDKMGYFRKACVYHHIPASRMTMEYIEKRRGYEGAADAYAKFRSERDWNRLELLNEVFYGLSSFCAERLLAEKCLAEGDAAAALRHRELAAQYSIYAQYFCHLDRSNEFADFVRFSDWLGENLPEPPRNIRFCNYDDLSFLSYLTKKL